jgi:hypothetical protein
MEVPEQIYATREREKAQQEAAQHRARIRGERGNEAPRRNVRVPYAYPDGKSVSVRATAHVSQGGAAEQNVGDARGGIRTHDLRLRRPRGRKW